MTLQEYVEKRDFSRTPEPAEAAPPARRRGPLLFAVQKHSATRLHYDLRLECDGVLKSWAVPNGPSYSPEDKRLAVMTEDHPFLYATFEGVIPRGQYGAGEMIVWDRGTYLPEGADASTPREEQEAILRKGIERGKIGIYFRGEKLQGGWTLVRTSRTPRDWLLLKKPDSTASPERDALADGRSVLSSLTIEELKGGHRPPTHATLTLDRKLAQVSGAKASAFPREVEPMVAGSAEGPFSNAGWLFEPKLDGYRVLAHLREGEVLLRSRRLLDDTKAYPGIAAELTLQTHDLVLDGEVVALDEQGRPSFDLLKQRLGEIKRSPRGGPNPLVYYVFDVLWADGHDLRGVTLEHRKALLKELVVQTDAVRLVDHVDEAGTAFYEAAIALGLEGIVAKRKSSLYESGRRSPSWLKVKSTSTAELVIGGFTRGKGHRADTLGAILLGQPTEDGRLRYIGHAGSGFDDKSVAALRRKLDRLASADCPFDGPVDTNAPPTWVRPELVAEVSYVEITRDNRLRAPVFVRLREDKSTGETGLSAPVQVVAETPRTVETRDDVSAVLEQLASPEKGMQLEVGDERLALTNLDKELWPGLTKRSYLTYLAAASRYILPHLKDRPLTLIRYPNGIDGERFYQKHWAAGKPDFVDTVMAYSDHNVGDALLTMVNNLPSLLWLGQVGALEFHAWYSRISRGPDEPQGSERFSGSLENMKGSRLNYPDYVVFDLDPVRAEGSEPRFEREKFKRVSDVALWLRELLDTLALSCFVKTTGRSGLHVFVPILRQLDYDATRAISQTVAKFIKAAHPKEIALEWAVTKRVGEVFVDTNQNVRGKTLAACFSPRATPEATVSMPLRWDEVGKALPTDFTIRSAVDRLNAIGDPWGEILTAKSDLASRLGAASA